MTEPSPQVVTEEIVDGVAYVTLNRPKALNALDDAMMSALAEVLPRVEQDASVRAVVVGGAGGHFMAGGDVKMFHDTLDQTTEQRRVTYEQIIHRLHVPMFALRRMAKPVVARVEGACVGFGMSLMMACDLAVASDTAVFGMGYAGIGTSPDGSSTYSLPRIVGLRKALELALLAEQFDAAEALRLGLVNRVVPAAEVDAATRALATKLAKGPTLAYAKTKELLHESAGNDYAQQLLREAECFATCASGDDFAEGVTAFVEKRRPSYRGR